MSPDRVSLGQTSHLTASAHPKITDDHFERHAALYVRQSSFTQLRDHQESTARQYGLKQLLHGFGWSDERVIVIDDDLGKSGSGSTDRPGFRRLLKLVTDQQVGLVLGLEMSRFARNSRDWQNLFEVCAVFNTLIADETGVFDPLDPNDRLILGLKGIIAEMEDYAIRVRLGGARLNKAKRGELFHDVPVGYVLDECGLPQLDPDESARHVMEMFFELFELVGSANGLFHYLVEHDIKLPFRTRGRRYGEQIDWRLPSKTGVYELLKHPLYAGAYGYGRRNSYRANDRKKQGKKYLPLDQWKVLIRDLHPGYITWEQYEQHQRRLMENDSRKGQRGGPIRGGSALLSGLVWCAHCGRRLSVNYPRHSHATYSCGRHYTVANGVPCHSTIRCATLDDFVSTKLLEVLAPSGVELSFRVLEDEEARREQLESLHVHRVERARYAVDLAERRYKQVDPANRLVAGKLEREWNAALVELDMITTEFEKVRGAQSLGLDDQERQEIQGSCACVASLWHEAATIVERKQIARLLLERVVVDVQDNTERVNVRLHWSGGFESCHEIRRTVMQFHQLEAYEQLMDRILELTLAGVRSPEVASILEQEGFRSPRSDTPISSMMVLNILNEQPRCRQQLTNPPLPPNHWRSADLAQQLGIPEKRLKDWVTRGWITAVQRPFGRVWVIYADEQELSRIKELARLQTGQGSQKAQESLRTPAPLPRKEA